MARYILILGAILVVVMFLVIGRVYHPSFERKEPEPVVDAHASDSTQMFSELLRQSRSEGFAQVTVPRAFSFPADHGPHPEYRVEWWYFTGNLETDGGRHFGYQLTFFRTSLTSTPIERASKWATSQMYMGHFALTDVKNERFYAFERLSRGALGLAGAQTQPFAVWVENWSAKVADDDNLLPTEGDSAKMPREFLTLTATEGDVGLSLVLKEGKPIVLNGEKGMSQKSGQAGAASYYYSLTRMPTSGEIHIHGDTFEVEGLSWLDREWGSSFLATDQVGWHWFALQLSDGREVMFYLLRKDGGAVDPLSSGTLVAIDGQSRRLTLSDVQIDVLSHWQSPIDQKHYPSRWRLEIPSAQLEVIVEPHLADQELNLSIRYWEGAVKVGGKSDGQPISGNGYVELTDF